MSIMYDAESQMSAARYFIKPSLEKLGCTVSAIGHPPTNVDLSPSV